MADGRWIPERWRRAHRWYAAAHGYFWAPCVLCGRYSGGHEWRHIDGKPAEVHLDPLHPTDGTGICPWCTRAGRGERAPGIICLCEDCTQWRGRAKRSLRLTRAFRAARCKT
jgi:hypothetical protein